MSRLEKALAEALRTKRQAALEDIDRIAPSGGEGAAPSRRETGFGVSEEAFGLATGGRVRAAEAITKSPYIIFSMEDNPFIAEEFGKIKSQIIRTAVKNPSCMKMLVASSLKGEGKTMVSLNLAISIARSYDYDVLFIEADLRNPSVSKYLGIEASPGLVQCIRDEVPLREAMVNIGMPNLGILTAGDVVKDPVEFLSAAQTRSWFEKILNSNREFFLIIDTPPVLPFADAHALLPVVGGVVYVVREGSASREQIEESLNSLGNFNLLGLVYNGARHGRYKNSHYNYYGYEKG